MAQSRRRSPSMRGHLPSHSHSSSIHRRTRCCSGYSVGYAALSSTVRSFGAKRAWSLSLMTIALWPLTIESIPSITTVMLADSSLV